MQTVLDALAHTPWWVYVLFAYLLTRGYKAWKGGTTSLIKMAIIPLAFTLWGLATLIEHFPITLGSVGMWLLGTAAGSAIGWALAARTALQVDRAHRLVKKPGSPLVLILLLAIFGFKYATGYLLATQPDLATMPGFYLPELFVTGLIKGVFLGQLLGTFQRYRDPGTPTFDSAQEAASRD